MSFKKFLIKVISRLPLVPKRKCCEVCGNNVFDFIPLSRFYEKQLKSHGFPYQSIDFETIDIENFYCPICFSFDRERLYMFYLKRCHSFLPASSMLEFAPSPGFTRVAPIQFKINYKTCDLYMPGVDFELDIQDLSVLQENSFDFIICSHVLEHIPNDLKAMRNMFRILKPGGKGIIMVPILKNFNGVDEDADCNDVSERWRRFGQDDHIRLYSRKVFVDRLQLAGFNVSIVHSDKFKADELRKFGIPQQFSLYIVSK
jgi:SAM-dependent methyltransferase